MNLELRKTFKYSLAAVAASRIPSLALPTIKTMPSVVIRPAAVVAGSAAIYSADGEAVALAIWLGIVAAFGQVAAARSQNQAGQIAMAQANVTNAQALVEIEKLKIAYGREQMMVQMAIEKMKLSFDYQMRTFALADQPVLQEAALNSGKQLARSAWSEDVDRIGTYMGVSSGQIAVERRGFSGTLTTIESANFARNIGQNGAMAVPVGGYETLSPDLSRRLRDVVEPVIGQGNSFIAHRQFSTAARPTESGWNLESVIYHDGTSTVKNVVVDRNMI